MSIILRLHISLFFLILIGCASQAPPSGGPQDKTPPTIISAEPADNSIKVDPSARITISFSEPIRQESLNNAFSLSPPPEGAVRSRWRGKTVELTFDSSFQDNRTYVLTLGTTLSDLQGNKLLYSFHLAFSTGDHLDQGQITGFLTGQGESVLGWNVIGYYMGSLPPSTKAFVEKRGIAESSPTKADFITAGSPPSKIKTPDPSSVIPDASTQTGEDGSWELKHLTAGLWRIFAFQDRDDDRLWTPNLEQIAVPSRDVQAYADSTQLPEIVYLRAAYPPVLPNVVRVVAKYPDLLEIKFDRIPAATDAVIEIVPFDSLDTKLDDSTIQSFPIRQVHYDPADSTRFRVRLKEEIEVAQVEMRIKGSFRSRETLDTSLVIDMTTAVPTDTVAPTFLGMFPKETSTFHPGFRSPILTFSEEIKLIGSDVIFISRDKDDSLAYPVPCREIDPFRLRVEPDSLLTTGYYQLKILGEKVLDLAGNALVDSVVTVAYTFFSFDSLGSVSGRIEESWVLAPFYLVLRSLGDVHLPLQIREETLGAFRFPAVPAGQWQLSGWVDFDRNSRYSYGNPLPMVASDPYVFHQDTITVRAHWESAGEAVQFK